MQKMKHVSPASKLVSSWTCKSRQKSSTLANGIAKGRQESAAPKAPCIRVCCVAQRSALRTRTARKVVEIRAKPSSEEIPSLPRGRRNFTISVEFPKGARHCRNPKRSGENGIILFTLAQDSHELLWPITGNSRSASFVPDIRPFDQQNALTDSQGCGFRGFPNAFHEMALGELRI